MHNLRVPFKNRSVNLPYSDVFSVDYTEYVDLTYRMKTMSNCVHCVHKEIIIVILMMLGRLLNFSWGFATA